ncbi:hypothetical protein LTR92_002206 [Exophiala xenobiotica]|nr:hypothetical protein LTR92_002206 [Exophiala xenobiotica]
MQVSALSQTALVYDALSYCWEGSVRSSSICINGHSFAITESLHQALHSIGTDELFWVDQICIDQDNNTEKSEQVALMTRIYSGCRICFCYLGPEDDDTYSALIQASYFHSLHNDWPFLYKAPFELPIDLSRVEGLQPLDVDKQALYRLLGRPYFRRRWVFQEVVVSRWSIGICGRYDFPMLPLLHTRLEQVKHLMEQGQLYRAKITSVMEANPFAMLTINKAWREKISGSDIAASGDTSLAHLLDLTTGSESGDQRDTFYALLGIASDRDAFPQPDYSISAVDVLFIFTIALIDEGYGCFAYAEPGVTIAQGCRHGFQPAFSIDSTEGNLRVRCTSLEKIAAVARITVDDNNDLLLAKSRLLAGYCLKYTDSSVCKDDLPFLKVVASLIMSLSHQDASVDNLALLLSNVLGSSDPSTVGVFPSDGSESTSVDSIALLASCRRVFEGMKIVMTETHRLCWAPIETRINDVAAVIEDAPNAVILRPHGLQTYEYIGLASLEEASSMEVRSYAGPTSQLPSAGGPQTITLV